MIYTNLKFMACILVAVLFTTTFAKPVLSLKEKLARLLLNPEYDDMNNEISDRDDDWQQSNQLRGMLLQTSELPARLMKNNLGLNNLFKNMKIAQSGEFFDDAEEAITTTTAAPTQAPNLVMVGMAPFRTMLNRFMEILRNSN